jgi:tRNA uridine 5-carbamoylmethylation protein Kti12
LCHLSWKVEAEAAQVIKHPHIIETSLTASQARNRRLEESNKQLNISLQQRHAEIQQLRKSFIDQEALLFYFCKAISGLHTDIGELLELWENIEMSKSIL